MNMLSAVGFPGAGIIVNVYGEAIGWIHGK
jgi:hypothetical protein